MSMIAGVELAVPTGRWRATALVEAVRARQPVAA
jgi:hypothetical protein